MLLATNKSRRPNRSDCRISLRNWAQNSKWKGKRRRRKRKTKTKQLPFRETGEGIALAVVDDHGPLPAALLVVVEFAQIGDDVLTRPGLGASALHQGVVSVGLSVLVASVAAQEHAGLPSTRMIGGRHGIKV
jgi:hypothetical protein